MDDTESLHFSLGCNALLPPWVLLLLLRCPHQFYSIRFKRSASDQAVYISSIKEHRLLVGVYVDDLIIRGSSAEEIENFKLPMKTPFDMTDFGLLISYLGIEVIQGNSEIRLCQKLYALKVLNEFIML